ncbi:MAG TPA: outer membrane beta-barrel protein [Cyclobacteriaceae bacterium]
MWKTKSQCNILLICCSIILVGANEEIYAQKFSLGLKGGGSINWAHFGEKGDKSNFSTRLKTGYSAGAFIIFPVNKSVSFLAEGGYSKKGRKILSNENTWTNTTTYNMVDLSMYLRKSFSFHLKENIPAEWFFNVGPEINYIMNAHGNIKVEGPGYNYTVKFSNDSIQDFRYMNYMHANRWLFGLGIGVGCRLPITSKQHVTVELRYISGHTYLGKKGTGLVTTNANQGYSYINILGYDDTLKTNIKTISLTVAYVFDFDIQKGRMGKSTLDKVIKRKK